MTAREPRHTSSARSLTAACCAALACLFSACSDPPASGEDVGPGADAGQTTSDTGATADASPARDTGEGSGEDAGEEPVGAPGCEAAPAPTGDVFYVDTAGDDGAGDGSADAPWATITHALDNATDGATILVRPGTYTGRVRMRGSFTQGVTVRSEVPYQARLRHDAAVVTFYAHPRGCEGITLEGFDVAHSGAGAGALVVHLDGAGDNSVSRITLRDNVLHDSFNNDVLKINNATTQILVERNMFYNQTGSDEHIDINSVDDVVVQDNVFFNDFEGSGRRDTGETSSYIVIKDSNGDSDLYTGSTNVVVRRNVFMNWQGNTGTGFVLIGEDGQPFFEGSDIMVENNLFIGNSPNDMRSPFGVKGGRRIMFRHNTVTGDLPSRAYAMRLNVEGENPTNEDIAFHNNIWADPAGTMGQPASLREAPDFSDTGLTDIASFTLDTNLYWNGDLALPESNLDEINPSDDANGIEGDPEFPDPGGHTLPRWDESVGQFADGSSSVCEAHRGVVEAYATPGVSSPARDAADPSESPADDILRRPRGTSPDLGAVEVP